MKTSWRVDPRCASLALLLLCSPPATAQNYPSQAIRLIVPQSSGSASDTMARLLGQRISATLGQQVVVDNRAGAGGLVGTELTAKAPPDGYTLMIASISSHGTIPALYRKLPFDPIKDFAPIALLTTIPNVLAVHPSLPVRSVKELIALAKAKPGALNVGSQGNGSSQHLATEYFNIMAGGLKMVHVPYKGSSPAITALMAGEVSVLMPTLALSLPHIEARKVRALAVTTPNRIEELPDLPPVSETVPGFDVQSWIGWVAPGATPRPVIQRLNEASAKAMALPELRKTLSAGGMTPTHTTPEQFGAFIVAEIAKWSKVAAAASIRAD